MLPNMVYALTTLAEPRIFLNETDIFENDLYMVSQSASLAGKVKGDLLSASLEFNLKGKVNGDLNAIFQRGFLEGDIGESARIVGVWIDFQGKVAKDLLLIGSEVYLQPKSLVGRDCLVIGNQVTITGTINDTVKVYARELHLRGRVVGNVEITAVNINVHPEAIIEGDLTWNSNNQPNISNSATIKGKVVGKSIYLPPLELPWRKSVSITFLLNLLALFFSGLVLSLLFPERFTPIKNQSKYYPYQSLGIGVISLLILPLIIAVLFVSIIGVPLGIMALFFLISTIYLGRIYTGFYLGEVLGQWFFPRRLPVYLSLLIGLTIILLLALIPVYGWIATLLSTIMGTGALLMSFILGFLHKRTKQKGQTLSER